MSAHRKDITIRLTALLATTLMLIAAFLSHTRAADIQFTNTETCTITLTGTIEPGDAEKLEQTTNRIKSFGRGRILCLESSGGSFSEAVKIAQLLREEVIETYVGDGANCLSACSIIFMFGTFPSELGPQASRKMHVNATIGFHRPQISLDGQASYSASQVEKAFSVAMQSVWELLRNANVRDALTGSNFLPSDLVEQMISVEGKESHFFLDTIEKL